MAMFKTLPAFIKLCSVTQLKSIYKYNAKPLVLASTNKINFIKSYCSHVQKNEEESDNQSHVSQNDKDFESLTAGNPEIKKKLQILMLEADVLRQEGGKSPDISQMKKEHWEQLLLLPTRSARRKYLSFLWQIEKKKESAAIKKDLARQSREEWRISQLEEAKNIMPKDKNEIDYGLHRNTMFLRIYDTTINQMLNNRLIQAMRFGQPLVLDCSYDKHMTAREAINTAKQLILLFAENRAHDQPFDLHYCNANMGGIVMKKLYSGIGTLNEPWFPLNVHQTSFLDHFPKKRLVYLTPHCRNDLTEFNHDDVYIIGAMVDKANSEPLSLAKAKECGIRVARFPLDRYLSWTSGSGKSLTLNQVCSILLDLRHTGSWDKALQHVPRRKVHNEEDEVKLRDKYIQKFNQRNRNDQMFQRKPKYKIYNNEKFIIDFEEDNDKYRTKNNFSVKKWAGSKKFNININDLNPNKIKPNEN